MKRCACGWPRPAIALTMRDGSMPPEGLVPVFLCPQCGTFHQADETSREELAAVAAAFDRIAQGEEPKKGEPPS